MAHETTSGFVGNFRHKIGHGLVSDSATTELQFQPAQLGILNVDFLLSFIRCIWG